MLYIYIYIYIYVCVYIKTVLLIEDIIISMHQNIFIFNF
jgi:hypothetical protein